MSLIDPLFWSRPRLCIAASLFALFLVALMLLIAIVVLWP